MPKPKKDTDSRRSVLSIPDLDLEEDDGGSGDAQSSEEPSPRASKDEAPTPESALFPIAETINRQKIGVHIDETVAEAWRAAWVKLLSVDPKLNKGVVVEAALRLAVEEFREKGEESRLYEVLEETVAAERSGDKDTNP
ncbi:hypothetical protein [Salisaeta longa]|uniref:hypothetical protein n=1 Tax=Salisaeta longa TaxID=503170 RepID=UPI0003B63949|nr:hypothetical protein [Salisaeta longa]